jgi:hypothetical protein
MNAPARYVERTADGTIRYTDGQVIYPARYPAHLRTAVDPAARPSTTAPSLAAVIADAQASWREFGGNLSVMLDNRVVNVVEAVTLPDVDFDRLARANGRHDRLDGLSMWRGGGWRIALRAGLAPSVERAVLLHELGHVRSTDLWGDRSEAAADAWRDGWRSMEPGGTRAVVAGTVGQPRWVRSPAGGYVVL